MAEGGVAQTVMSSSKTEEEPPQIVPDFSDDELAELKPKVKSWERVFNHLRDAGSSAPTFEVFKSTVANELKLRLTDTLMDWQSGKKRIELAEALHDIRDFALSATILLGIQPSEIINMFERVTSVIMHAGNMVTLFDTDIGAFERWFQFCRSVVPKDLISRAQLADVLEAKGFKELAAIVFESISADSLERANEIRLVIDTLSGSSSSDTGPRRRAIGSLSTLSWDTIVPWLLYGHSNPTIRQKYLNEEDINMRLYVLNELMSLRHRRGKNYVILASNVSRKDIIVIVQSTKNMHELLERLRIPFPAEVDTSFKGYIKTNVTRHELFLALRLSGYCQQAEMLYDIQQNDEFVTKTLSSSGEAVDFEDLGVHINIPYGALSKPQKITFHRLSEQPTDHLNDSVPLVPGIRCCPSGLTFNSPIELTIRHAASITNLEKASKEGIILYTRQEKGPKETWKIQQHPLESDTGINVTLLRDKVVLRLTHFTSFWELIGRLFIGRRTFRVMPFLPEDMPGTRIPLLHLHVYSTEIIPKVIKEEEREANYRMVRCSQEFKMKYNGKDLEATCSDCIKEFSQPCRIPYSTLEMLEPSQLVFPLDFKTDQNNKNVEIALSQDDHIKNDPVAFSTYYQDQSTERLDADTQSGKVHGIPESILMSIAEKFPGGDDTLYKLALQLGIPFSDARQYMAGNANRKGTMDMLMAWQKKTLPALQVHVLIKALIASNCLAVAETHFPAEVSRQMSVDTDVVQDLASLSITGSQIVSGETVGKLAPLIPGTSVLDFFCDLQCERKHVEKVLRTWGNSYRSASLHLLNECLIRGLDKTRLTSVLRKHNLDFLISDLHLE